MVLEVTGLVTVLAIGVFGGSLAELAKWVGLRENNSQNLPHYAKSPFYWIITILLILAGGGLALLYGYTNVNALLAANIGASAPLIIRALASTAPSGTSGVPPDKSIVKPPVSLLNFLAGR